MPQRHLLEILVSLRDNSSDLEKAFEMLYQLQRSRGPVAEIVTVMKYEKPVLHQILKKRVQNNPGLNMVFDLSLDYEHAKKMVYGTAVSDPSS